VSSFDTTKSCPGLVELKQPELAHQKLVGVTIATQTDDLVVITAHTEKNREEKNVVRPSDNETFHDLPEFKDAEEEFDDENR